MRRNAKAPSTGSIPAAGSRLGRIFGGAPATRGAFPRARGSSAPSARLLTALFAIAALFAIVAPSASATAPTPAGPCPGAGCFTGADITPTPASSFVPTRLAVDETTNDVYVIDQANDAVDKFSATGTFISQIPGSSTALGSFGFGGDDAVVVDNTGGVNAGNVYVVTEHAAFGAGVSGGIFAFDNTGAFLWQQSAVSAAVPGGSWDSCGVSLDPTGHPWVTDYVGKRALQFTPAGALTGETITTTGSSCHSAFDTLGNFYGTIWGGEVIQYEASAFTTSSIFQAESHHDVAIDSSNNDVYGTQPTDVLVSDSSGAPVLGTPFGAFVGAVGIVVNGETGKIYVADPGTTEAGRGTVDIFDRAAQGPTKELTLTKTGAGTGKVTSTPPGINCGTACASKTAKFEENGTVTLEAEEDPHNEFKGWTGCESEPSATECEVTMSADKTVEAEFAKTPQEPLEVTVTGNGEVNGPGGTVSVSECTETTGVCTGEYDHNSTVPLTETPQAHNKFIGWSGPDAGACTTEEICEVAIGEAPASITAEYAEIPQKELTVELTGLGSGNVANVSPGFFEINCPEINCSKSFDEGTTVVLVAIANEHNKFVAWTNCPTETTVFGFPGCEVVMTADTTIEAEYAPIPQQQLTVSVTGNGEVTSTPPGIACTSAGGASCEAGFDEEGPGSEVELAASPATHNELTAWGGACSGTLVSESCHVTMSAAKSASATFAPTERSVTLSVTGGGSVSAGSGTIAGCTSAGGASCEGQYEDGSPLVFTAAPLANQQVTGWTGCTQLVNPNECEIAEVNADTPVTVTMAPIAHALTVTAAGTGAGTVSANSGAISNCSKSGGVCSGPYNQGSTVTLTATAAHSSFSGWSGASVGSCDTSGATLTCEVAIGAANAAITATFAQDKPAISGEEATGIAQHAATLGGKVNPNGANVTTCKFEWGTTTSYGTTVACSTLPGAGTEPKAVTIPALSGLNPSTTYHYRIDATNSGGVTEGTDHTFTTLADTCATNSALCPPAEKNCANTPSLCLPPPPVTCVVPKLAKKSLGQAKSALAAAHCTLGKVTKPKPKKGKKLGPLVVKSSKPGAGASLADGSKVDLKLGPKPKKKKH